MNIATYIPNEEDYRDVAEAKTLRASRALLAACEIKREELRVVNENKPKESPDDLTKDFRFVAGFISGLNFVLSLPVEVGRYKEALEQKVKGSK